MKHSNQRIGEIFRAWREQAGVSVEELAEYLGISPIELEESEAGDRPLSLEEICGYSNCLNIAPSDVVQQLYLITQEEEIAGAKAKKA